MKIYKKENLIKSENNIVLIKDDMQIFNPTHEMIIEDGWIEIQETVLTDEQKLVRAVKDKLLEITEYDASSAVNEFFMQDKPIWLDKATRAGLMLRFQSESTLGDEMTTLWYNGEQYHLPLTHAINMLYMIEKYASACYDNTQYHLSMVNSLDTIEAIEAYDYTTGYPEKLRF